MFIIDALDPEHPRLIGVFEREEDRDEMEAAMDRVGPRNSRGLCGPARLMETEKRVGVFRAG
jgi:hypothetical protein